MVKNINNSVFFNTAMKIYIYIFYKDIVENN